MIYLRHYPVDLFLCVLFNASRQTIYNTRTRVLDWLYDTLKDRLTARSLQWRLDRSVEYLSHVLPLLLTEVRSLCYIQQTRSLTLSFILLRRSTQLILW